MNLPVDIAPALDLTLGVGAQTPQNIQSNVLGKIAELFKTLKTNGFVYCHWKSNEHLDASMRGDTDLDVLFQNAQKGSLLKVLDKLGFRRFNAVPEKIYAGIEDFIGLDDDSGKIIHLHAHFTMTMGEPYLKSYHWPIESALFAHCIQDPIYGITRTSPSDELVLLFVRHALKLRRREKIRIGFARKETSPSQALREFIWLNAQTTQPEIASSCNRLFSNSARIQQIITGKFSYRALRRLSNELRDQMKGYRLYSEPRATAKRWTRELTIRFSRFLASHTGIPVLQKRTASGGGLVVALIGADGSGKSTVFKNLQNTFGKKIDIYPIYFGSGNFTTITKRIFRLMKRGVRSPKGASTVQSKTGTAGKKTSSVRGILNRWIDVFDSYEVALRKKRLLNRMATARRKGMLVLCDRFPQCQFMNLNDGPRLSHLRGSHNPIFRLLSRKEFEIYRLAETFSPDLVFKLIADPEVVEARKPGLTPIDVLKRKIAAVRQIDFPHHTQVVTVNAAIPLESVLSIVKKTIWLFIKS